MPASSEREIAGLHQKDGRCQTTHVDISAERRNPGRRNFYITIIAVSGPCATKRIDPLALGDTELPGVLRRSEYAGCSQIDGVERVHQHRI